MLFVLHELAVFGWLSQLGIAVLCWDKVWENLCLSWLFCSQGDVGKIEGLLSFEYMACVGVRHISRITLFSFTFEIWDMFLYTLFEANS